MKFSAGLGVLSIFAAASSAAPIKASKPGSGSKGMGSVVPMGGNATKSSSSVMGAAYLITNEPSGNFIVAANINSDGTLTLSTATATGGLGQHGDDGGANGPDALFSQGAIKANANASLLAAVNPGSNTVSLFEIDAKNPANLRAVGAPVGSGGEFPMSVAFNSAGDTLCVLNGGATNGVQCFDTTDRNLGLKPIASSMRSLGLNQTTPAAGPAGSASHLIFSEDGATLFAAVKGNPAVNASGFLAAWNVADDGSLSTDFTPISPPAGGNLPFALANVPGASNALIVADAAIGADVFDLSQGAKLAAQSNATQTVAVDGQGAVCWIAHSAKTQSFFVTDIKTSLVTEIALDDKLAGSVVKQYPTQNGAATIDLDVASLGGNDFLYVNMANATAIQAFSLPGQGQATKLQTLDIAKPAKAAGLTLNAANIQGMTVFVRT